MVFGILLFIARATEYVASNIFISKMFVVGIGAANALVLSLVPQAHIAETAPTHGNPSAILRVAAGISLIAWLTALILGRLIGYF
jgi:hypothetical protein